MRRNQKSQPKRKKLRLYRESLRELTPEGLGEVNGGGQPPSKGQPYTALCNNSQVL